MTTSDKAAQPNAIHLKDYRPPAYLINSLDLIFDIYDDYTHVTNKIEVLRDQSTPNAAPLTLDGEDLELISLKVDGVNLTQDKYEVGSQQLRIDMPAGMRFLLEIKNKIYPSKNKSLEGLYEAAGEVLCTQCEAEGFRKITYHLDRPDVLSLYQVTITANEFKYPVLLSNGNRISAEKLEGGRHKVTWRDPFPKPSYLFALAAGKLEKLSTNISTMSKKNVTLEIYTEKAFINRCHFALEALQESMLWDEKAYGFEYDLDRYMILAVRDFNMGAMENKGLNIFNAKYVMCDPETATDDDYEDVLATIGHEYFHNWTGNRITCRDWFQLSLKEGLTVFREQQFMDAVGAAAYNRIHHVIRLRNFQFVEDSGPMAHPVRPESYIEINNFYTPTVYEKGAEVCRMLYNLMGDEGFYQGVRLWVSRFDGKATTVDDFIKAFEEANSVDLGQFFNWYRQSGTPEVVASGLYNASEKSYSLTLKQSCPATPGQPVKKPFYIPFSVGLLDKNGDEYEVKVDKARLSKDQKTAVLSLSETEQTFVFKDVPSPPIPSLLRGFSSPIKLKHNLSEDQLYHLMLHDSDAFVRWEAFQLVYENMFLGLYHDFIKGRPLRISEELTSIIKKTLLGAIADKRLIGLFIDPPTPYMLGQKMQPINVAALEHIYSFYCNHLSKALSKEFFQVYQENNSLTPYGRSFEETGRRSLKNFCLLWLMRLDDPDYHKICFQQFYHSNNMTDEYGAMSAMVHSHAVDRESLFQDFYKNWKKEPMVLDKWFGIMSESAKSISDIKKLLGHPEFNLYNPNRVRIVFSLLSRSNMGVFHDASGAGYRLLADTVLKIDAFNPQLAANIIKTMTLWQQFASPYKEEMRLALENLAKNSLSNNTYEVVAKSLTL